ncbi:MAG TPA: MFS transporter [Steroidobacteraceae bacterium]|nr:MFS transporter [Steroidobacteraceae bacterium]
MPIRSGAEFVLGANRMPRRNIFAVTLGNALEFYDFVTYAFFSIQIGHAFFPAQSAYGSLMLSLATFGAGFLTRPLGAFVIGNYADRVGRRAAMLLCFVLMGCAIVGMALIPSYATIGIAAPILAVIARMTQGFSLGGEIGSNTAYLAEAATPESRGLVVSWQGASQSAAVMTGSLVGVLLTSVLPAASLDAYGWRIAFLLGAATVPFGLWLRMRLPETLHQSATATPAAPAAPIPARLALARRYWPIFACGLVFIASGTIATYIFGYIVTYAQDTMHLSARVGFIASTGGNLLGIPVTLYAGWLSDRRGRRPVMIWGNLLFLLLIYPTFAWIAATRSEFAFITGMIFLNAVQGLAVGAFYAALAESLPQAIRGAGFGITYSLAIAIFGGTTQLVVTWLLHVTGNPVAPAWYLTGAALMGQIALMLMPESAPVKLARAAGR